MALVSVEVAQRSARLEGRKGKDGDGEQRAHHADLWNQVDDRVVSVHDGLVSLCLDLMGDRIPGGRVPRVRPDRTPAPTEDRRVTTHAKSGDPQGHSPGQPGRISAQQLHDLIEPRERDHRQRGQDSDPHGSEPAPVDEMPSEAVQRGRHCGQDDDAQLPGGRVREEDSPRDDGRRHEPRQSGRPPAGRDAQQCGQGEDQRVGQDVAVRPYADEVFAVRQRVVDDRQPGTGLVERDRQDRDTTECDPLGDDGSGCAGTDENCEKRDLRIQHEVAERLLSVDRPRQRRRTPSQESQHGSGHRGEPQPRHLETCPEQRDPRRDPQRVAEQGEQRQRVGQEEEVDRNHCGPDRAAESS